MATRKKESLPGDLNAFADQVAQDSDRGAGLVAAALLDAQLEDLFRRRLVDHQDSLLDPSGTVGTFGARIKLAKALGWIDADIEFDLKLIGNIRNKLAHSFAHALSFDEPTIAGWCSTLRTTNAYLTGFDLAKDRLHKNWSLSVIDAWRAVVAPPRGRYQITANFLAQHLKELADSGHASKGFLQEVKDLGANFTVRFAAVGTVGNAKADTQA